MKAKRWIVPTYMMGICHGVALGVANFLGLDAVLVGSASLIAAFGMGAFLARLT